MAVTLYHNPKCSKSRATLALLEDNGHSPTIVEYLKDVPDVETLTSILDQLGMKPRDLMRKGEAAYKEQGLDSESISDQELVKAMVASPILIERPVVVAMVKPELADHLSPSSKFSSPSHFAPETDIASRASTYERHKKC